MTFRTVATSLLLLLVLALPAARAEEQVLNGIAAVVNSDVITYSEVQEMVGPRENTLKETYTGQDLEDKVKDLRMQAVQVLIDNQLILQDFAKNKYTIPDYVVDQEIQDRIKSQFGGDREAFRRTLAAQGMTMERFRKMVLDGIIVQAMREKSVKDDTIIAPHAIQDYYEKNVASYTTPAQVHLFMILIKQNGDAGKQMAEELRQKALGGADFDKLAELYSEDPSVPNGDWGWIDNKTLNDKLTGIAFALKPGDVSEVVELGGNYYLLYVAARKDATTKSLTDVHDDIENKLVAQQRQMAEEKWINGLRQKAYIWIDGVTSTDGSHAPEDERATAQDSTPQTEN
ncbi:MAG: peptidyl-prolyl cis-trans isomerase [Chthoniobacteraceae bacterium]|jgi:peptidyl-prolyl cis-trans isomerase SurA